MARQSSARRRSAPQNRWQAPPDAPRREDILGAASLIFNERGFSNTRVHDITSRLSLTRAALYYYFPDLDALAFHCYRRSLGFMEAALDAAAASRGTSLDRIAVLADALLQPEILSSAALIETHVLSQPYMAEIRELRDSVYARVQALVAEGQRDGSVGDCDATIASIVLLSALGYATLAVQAGRETRLDDVRRGYGDFLRFGLRARSLPAMTFRPLPQLLLQDSTNPGFNRAAVAERKRDALLKTATQLFNRHGVNGTTLDGVTRELKVTKGALYHYVRTKDDLLEQCFERSFKLAERVNEAVEQLDGSGLDRVANMARYLVHAHASEAGPFGIFHGFLGLSLKRRANTLRRVRALEKNLHTWLELGIADESIRPCRPTVVQLAIDGALRWMPEWYWWQARRHSEEHIAESFTRILVDGLGVRSASL
jgi:AcrR family transcriptional regulator